MTIWPLQEAKIHLGKMIRLSKLEGPQVITVQEQEVAVLVSKQDYERLSGNKQNLFDFINDSPLKGLDITFERK